MSTELLSNSYILGRGVGAPYDIRPDHNELLSGRALLGPGAPIRLQNLQLVISAAGRLPSWFPNFFMRLDSLVALSHNWDSYGGLPISENSIRAAVRFAVLHPAVPTPTIVPHSSGSVGLEWHRNGVDLEVTFEPRGGLSFTASSVSEEIYESSSLAELDSVLARLA